MANTIVQATVLSHDLVNPSDVAAMIGASAALCLSDIPFHNPIGGIRVGRVDGEFVTNPTPTQLEESELNIFMAGSKDAILMVEGEADEVSEAVMQEAIWYGHKQIQPIIEMQEELVKRVGKEKRTVPAPEVNAELQQKVDSSATSRVQDALRISDKQERYTRMDALQEEVVAEVLGDTPEALRRKRCGSGFSPTRSGLTDADPRTSARSPAKPMHCRVHTARRSSLVERRRPWP
jgi:polyribonucleotide nucleotidyltransferase